LITIVYYWHSEVILLSYNIQTVSELKQKFPPTSTAQISGGNSSTAATLSLFSCLCFLEPELQAAQQEVDELRQEVHKLKKYGKIFFHALFFSLFPKNCQMLLSLYWV